MIKEAGVGPLFKTASIRIFLDLVQVENFPTLIRTSSGRSLRWSLRRLGWVGVTPSSQSMVSKWGRMARDVMYQSNSLSSLREDEPSPLPPLLLRRNNVWKPEKYSTSKLATDFLKGRGGGGQVVNVLAFYPCGLSSNPTEAYSFFHKMCVWKERK